MHRVLLLLFALLWATPAAAQYGLRIKIDRYQRATLPEVKLWVTVTAPVSVGVPSLTLKASSTSKVLSAMVVTVKV